MQDSKELTKIDKYNELKSDLLNVSRRLIGEKMIDPDSNYARDVEKLIEELKNDDFKIGMFGIIAAGKSTIINALMGENFLKQGMGETSKVITYIRKPHADNAEGSMVIEYKTVEEIGAEIRSVLTENMMIPVEDIETFRQSALKAWDIRDSEVRTKLKNIINSSVEKGSVNQKNAARYLQRILRGFQQCEDKICTIEESKEKGLNFEKGAAVEIKNRFDENNDSIDAGDERERSESNSSMIKRVTIYNTNKLTEKDVVLIDSPGLGSNFLRHTSMTEKVLFEADAIVMITKPDYKFSPIDRTFLQKYETNILRQQRESNIIFVLNKIGTIPENQSSPQKEADKLKGMLEEFGLKDVKVFKTDAERAMWSKLIKNERTLIKEERIAFNKSALMDEEGLIIKDIEKNLESSGVPNFEKTMADTIFGIKIRKSLSNKYGRMECIIKDFRTAAESKINSLFKTEEELEEERQNIKDDKKAVTHMMNSFFITFDKQLEDQVYSDKEELISELISKINKILLEGIDALMSVKKYWLTQQIDKRFAEEIADYCKDDIDKEIHYVRKTFEKRYLDLRKNSIQKEIPVLLKKYKSISDKLDLNIIKEIETNPLKSLANTIKDEMGFMENLFLWTMVITAGPLFWVIAETIEYFDKRTDAEKAADNERTVLEGRKNCLEKIGTKLSEKTSKTSQEIKTIAFEWITKDVENFKENTIGIINKFYEGLDYDILCKIDALKLTEDERKEKEKQLKVFISKTTAILASNEMEELRHNIKILTVG